MTIPEAIGILALVYLINIVLVEFLGIRPYWTIYVPGLPVVVALLFVATGLSIFLLCFLIGIAIGLAIFVNAIICIPTLWQKDKAPEVAYREPELKIV